MSTETQQQKLETLAKELAKDIKTEHDLSDLSRRLLKLTVETALGAEAEAHHHGSSNRDRRPEPCSAFNECAKRKGNQDGLDAAVREDPVLLPELDVGGVFHAASAGRRVAHIASTFFRRYGILNGVHVPSPGTHRSTRPAMGSPSTIPCSVPCGCSMID